MGEKFHVPIMSNDNSKFNPDGIVITNSEQKLETIPLNSFDVDLTSINNNIVSLQSNLVLVSDVVAAQTKTVIVDIQWNVTKLQIKTCTITNGIFGTTSDWTDVPTV